MFRAVQNREKRADARAGIIAAILVNQNRRKGAKAVSPADLFPSLADKKPKRRMSGDEVRDSLIAFFAPNRAQGSAARRDASR